MPAGMSTPSKQSRQNIERLLFSEATMMSIHSPTLCRQCEKGIPLDDLSLVDFVKDSAGGNKVLRMDTNHADPVSIQLGYKRHDKLPDLPALTRSADHHCSFCAFLKGAIQARKYACTGAVEITFGYQWDTFDDPDEDRLAGLSALIATMMVMASDGIVDVEHFFTFTIETNREDKCAEWLGIRPLPESIPWCEKNINMVRDQLDHSLAVCCPHGDRSEFIPARLVDLGTQKNAVPRLVQTTTPSTDSSHRVSIPEASYAALSYCWGPPETATQLLTKQASLPSRLTAIHISTMPKTLQDAITVCRTLSIRYLWVDCLCIIQDDKDDWARESEQMGKVYENAKLTICALAASSSDQGFLTRSPDVVEIPFQSKLAPGAIGMYRLTYRPTLDKEWDQGDGYYSFLIDYEYCAWKSRGWTCQEELLSKRLLYFGESRLYFLCGHRLCTENNLRKVQMPYSHLVSNTVSQSRPTDASLVEFLSEKYDEWYSVASDYNTRQLSYQIDKFPALSGLAKTMGAILDDEYLAGLWRKDILRGLMWRTAADKGWNDYIHILASESESKAPSWSWASHSKWFEMGTCHYYLNSTNTTSLAIYIENHDVRLAGSNPFGCLESATLTLMGKTILCPPILFLSSKQMMRLLPTWDIRFDGQSIYTCELDWLCHDSECQVPRGLSMLKLGTCSNWVGRAGPTGQVVVWGLLLMPTEKKLDEYRRVGIFSSHKFEESDKDPFKYCRPRRLRLI